SEKKKKKEEKASSRARALGRLALALSPAQSIDPIQPPSPADPAIPTADLAAGPSPASAPQHRVDPAVARGRESPSPSDPAVFATDPRRSVVACVGTATPAGSLCCCRRDVDDSRSQSGAAPATVAGRSKHPRRPFRAVVIINIVPATTGSSPKLRGWEQGKESNVFTLDNIRRSLIKLVTCYSSATTVILIIQYI
uniref:Uncharacterized protein n=1 Tax=Leersia perrieri TaxID=77586 RepID=A0A0D9XDH1_9ORYZ